MRSIRDAQEKLKGKSDRYNRKKTLPRLMTHRVAVGIEHRWVAGPTTT